MIEFYKGYQSSTHQPLLRAVIKAYKPQFILELGIGDYSTPILSGAGAAYLGIENDNEWIKRFPGLDIIHHPVNFGLSDNLRSVPNELIGLHNYYCGISIPSDKPNLLFVDNWTACRMIAINSLSDRFDLIIYHDCQPKNIPTYNYNGINHAGFGVKYLTSPTSWTGLMYREDKELDIQPFIDEYLKEWPEAAPMNLR
jgi:hypothetical protein